MEKRDVIVLAQLLKEMQLRATTIEHAKEENNAKKIEQIQQELLELQKRVDELL